ncbi:MFS transporter, MCP family, solute carrier family 16, member 7 [Xylogone sp. PMI_703]|nr:MFS transporter, MCP family, solute carrier family 16, member 7 [Xylogone sp. PMI_703]
MSQNNIMDKSTTETSMSAQEQPVDELELGTRTSTAENLSIREPDNRPQLSKYYPVFVVASGFTVTSMTCSIIFAFGVYQALYEEMAKQPSNPFTGTSTALIGLVGILAIALMTIGGPFVLLWSKIYSPQIVISAGGVVFGIAFILASFSQYLWQFALTQGVLAGLGTSMSYVPMTAVAPTWFTERRGLAMGIIMAGTGVGGMMWPPVLRALISHVGFRNAMRVSGCISTLLVAVAGFALKWEPRFGERIRLETQGWNKQTAWFLKLPVVDLKVAKSRKFASQALSTFLQSAAYSTPLFFYAAYAQSRGYSTGAAANFITISNASNFVSRIAIGWAADKYGRLNALFITTLISAVAVLAFWLPSTFYSHEYQGAVADVLFIFFTILYGAFASAYISLFPACLIELFGVQHFTSVNGALSLIRGIGALLGTPLTGLLIPQQTALILPTAYKHAAVTVGVLMLVASLATGWARLEATTGQKRWKWKA